MKKKILCSAVGVALLFSGQAFAEKRSLDANSFMPSRVFLDASGLPKRVFDGRLAIEFSQPVTSMAGGLVVKLVESASKLTGLKLNAERMMMGRFVVVRVADAKSDGDVVSAINRLLSVPGVMNVEPNY